jgi:hypothetical protein
LGAYCFAFLKNSSISKRGRRLRVASEGCRLAFPFYSLART